MNELVIRTEMDGDEFEWHMGSNPEDLECEGCEQVIPAGRAFWTVYGVAMVESFGGYPPVPEYCGRCASGFLHDVTSAEVYPADATAPVRDGGEIGFFNDTWLEYPHPNPWRYDLYDEATGRTAPVTQENVKLLRHGQALCVGTHLYRLEDIGPDSDGDEMAWVGFVLNSKGEGDEIRFRWSLLPKG